MLTDNKPEEKNTIDIVSSEYEAYKRWGIAASPSPEFVEDEYIATQSSKLTVVNDSGTKTNSKT